MESKRSLQQLSSRFLMCILGQRELGRLGSEGCNFAMMIIERCLGHSFKSLSMVRRHCNSVPLVQDFAAAKMSSSSPPPILPEIAFAGVSNIGKSSLLNARTRQWGIVRTSDKPCLTRGFSFYGNSFACSSEIKLVTDSEIIW